MAETDSRLIMTSFFNEDRLKRKWKDEHLSASVYRVDVLFVRTCLIILGDLAFLTRERSVEEARKQVEIFDSKDPRSRMEENNAVVRSRKH